MNKEDLLVLVDNGLSVRKIASSINLSQNTVRYWLKKYSLKIGTRPKFRCACGETDPSKFYGHKKKICGKCHSRYTLQKGRETRRKIVEFLGGSCKICGYNKCIRAMDVHHPDKTQKDPSFKSIRGWSWDKIVEEISKCVLLCRNCHAELHAEEFE